MSRLYWYALVFFLLVGTTSLWRGDVAARSSGSDGALTGELVVTDASRSQFRLVGHEGRFTAPAGVSLDALDGKAVQVELAGGRVHRITPLDIPIEPIAHGQEVIWGELIQRDSMGGRAFSIAGYDAVYTAPVGIDISPYAGRDVRVTFDEDGRLTDIAATDRVAAPRPTSGCPYRALVYENGARRCEGGTEFLCEAGAWRNLGTLCATRTSESSRPRTCLFHDATVAAGSSMCRQGVTYTCADGVWVNVGTPCS